MLLYTIEATLRYDDLPVNLKYGRSPGFGATFLDYVGENSIAIQLVSINGRLCSKRIFIGDNELAEKFVLHLQANADKKKRPYTFKARKVTDSDLNYRRKRVQAEAEENNAAIKSILKMDIK